MREQAGNAVADRIEQSAEYLRDRDTGQVMSGVEKYIREHPMQAVLGAVAIGFFIGRRLR
jgi:ElaB/YqjD/DUF883 family membrane-anchored ribosome-binding protein